MIDVELKGLFPDYGLATPPRHVYACTDQSLNDAAELAMRPEEGKPKKGWYVEEHPRYGITKFEMPYDPDGIYIMAGDPGIHSSPRRNSPVVIVMDTRERPGKIVYFDSVDGKGSYNPFLFSYKYAIEKTARSCAGWTPRARRKRLMSWLSRMWVFMWTGSTSAEIKRRCSTACLSRSPTMR